MKPIAVVRIRGDVGVKADIKKTMELLKLKKKNSCIVVPNSGKYMGMIKKIKDFITYGEIDKGTLVALLKARSDSKSPDKDAKQAFDKGSLKIVFRLHPPRGGFKTTKKTFKSKGDLGYRGEKINELLKRMI